MSLKSTLHTMDQLLNVFKDASGVKGQKSLSIDSWSFKLFNTVTTPLLICCSIAVSARQFFGEPVRCDAGSVRKRNNHASGCGIRSWFSDGVCDGVLGEGQLALIMHCNQLLSRPFY